MGCARGTEVDVKTGTRVRSVLGLGVRGVAVSTKKRKGVGEGVLLGVTVIVGVTVGVFVIVALGPVGVAKGP